MEHTDTESNSKNTQELDSAAMPSGEVGKENKHMGEPKSYYFETQTKRLKAYYLQHQKELTGRKVLFNNSAGIVRYFGELVHPNKPASSKDELWVGIEWDQDNRGKHNGTVNGHKYFQCAANKGSMIKYEKIEFGYRLEIALFKRYFKSEELHHAKDIYDNLKEIKEEMKQEEQKGGEKEEGLFGAIAKKVHKVEYDVEAYLDTVKNSKKILIEFVGFDEIWNKINNIDKIQSISLADCRICDLGQFGHLSGLFKNLKVVSLESNLLSDWNQIYQLGCELPQLNELSISENTLHEPEQSFEDLSVIPITGRPDSFSLQGMEPFKNLRSLILISSKLTWKSFFKVVAAFKKVHEFILCRNDLSDFQNIDKSKLDYLNDARFLNLEQTKITNFNDLHVFSKLPKLERLILNKNPLKQIGREVTGFASLKHLSVQMCNFYKTVVLYEISLIASLESVNVKHNPIGDKFGNSYVRMRAVAEVQKLNQINGAPIKKVERKDFEIFYLRDAFRQYFAFKKVPDYDYDFQDFLKYCEEHHPNIPRLIKIYGNPYEVEKQQIQVLIKEEVKATENKKGTGMVQVTIQSRITGLTDYKKIPLSWTLSSLKNFFSKTIKIPINKLKLTSIADQNANEQEMTQDHKTLSFYSLKTGSKIIVEQNI